MLEIKDNCYKGTRILLGNAKRDVINLMVEVLRLNSFVEIAIPIIQSQEVFRDKVGIENSNMMYNLTDAGDRRLCLAPEYTAIIQMLAATRFKQNKDLRMFYVQQCFRGEKPQAGRYREFTQLGVEVINPVSPDSLEFLAKLAMTLIHRVLPYAITINDFEINHNVVRGLDYYKNGKGFEIICEKLGAQKQICGGGEYEGGIGFAIGIDRLLTLI